MDFEDAPDDLDDSPEPIEAYCVRCREMVEMDEPMAVWTRRGMPATRGDCPICGGTVFRMGRSVMHERSGTTEAQPRIKLARETVYLAFAAVDAPAAEGLAAALERVGVACWLHDDAVDGGVNWAEGVHPALSACARLIFVLTDAGLRDAKVEAAWQYFREKRKPILVAQYAAVAPPDDLRRRPRFDLRRKDKTAFRQLLEALYDGK